MKADPFQTRRDYAATPVRLGSDRGDGNGVRRLYITQDDGSGNNAYFFSSIVGGTVPFECVPNVDGTGTVIDVDWANDFVGVRFTGQPVWVSNLPTPASESRSRQVAHDGVTAWYGVEADGDIVSGAGYALLDYWRFCPGASGSVDYCRVPVVAGDTTFNVADGGLCDVAFNQRTGQFVVTRAYCPGA